MKRTLFVFLAVLHLAVVAVPALATTTNYSYVRAGCGNNGLGDANSCAASPGGTGAYNSMANWQTGEVRDLTSTDEIEHVYFDTESSAADTGFPLTISSSWATDSTRYVIWEAVGDHGGTWTDTVYHAVSSDTSSSTTMIAFGGDTIEHIRIIGLQFYWSGASHSSTNYGIRVQGDSNAFEISKCIFKGNDSFSSSSNRYVLSFGRTSATSGTHKLWNNLFYDLNNDGTGSNTDIQVGYSVSSTVVTSIYNSTFIAPDYAIYNSDTNSTVYSYNNGCDSCATALKNANVSGGTGDSSSTPTFVGGSDYHLASSDTTWKDQTSDQSSGLFSDDIDGETRTGSWDIGADEYVAAGGGGQVIMYSRLLQGQWR